MTGLALRPFAAADDEELLAWFGSPHELRLFAGDSLRWPVGADQLERIRADRTVSAWTATLGDEVAGHVELTWLAEAGWARLARVALAPRRRGQGLGPTLVAAAVAQARAAGMKGVDLRVYADNAPARRTYAAVGFVDIGADRSQPDLRWMVKRLEAG